MKPKLFLLLTIFLFIGCASNGAERKPMRSKNFISQEEIKELTVARTAKDAIEQAGGKAYIVYSDDGTKFL